MTIETKKLVITEELKRKTNIFRLMLVFNHPINFTKNNQVG